MQPRRVAPRRFTVLGALPDPDAGVSDITDLYVAKYGVPPPAPGSSFARGRWRTAGKTYRRTRPLSCRRRNRRIGQASCRTRSRPAVVQVGPAPAGNGESHLAGGACGRAWTSCGGGKGFDGEQHSWRGGLRLNSQWPIADSRLQTATAQAVVHAASLTWLQGDLKLRDASARLRRNSRCTKVYGFVYRYCTDGVPMVY